MRKIDCDSCENKDVPFNDTIKIDGKVYCNNCIDSHFPDSSELKNRVVEKQIDPTICTSCNKDFGSLVLDKISTHPICDECHQLIKNKTFPLWVKAFFIGIMIIIVGSFAWNWKYYSAYRDFRKSNEYIGAGDLAKASLYMKSASDKVPEVEDVKTLSIFYHGMELYNEDKNEEAFIEFQKCRNRLPEDFQIDKYILQAQAGATFDKKDYPGFLSASKERFALDSADANSLSSLASAYACMYASTSKEVYKDSAMSFLAKAKLMDSTDNDLKVYYNFIEYRLASHIIITRKEFDKQFPNGWIKN